MEKNKISNKVKLLNFLLSKGLILIMIIFFINGITGLFFDYSLNTGGDETTVMAATVKMISEHNLRPNYPTFYHVPLAVYFYLLPFILFFAFLRLTGVFTDLNALKEFGIINFYSLLPFARFLTVLMGLVAIYFLYKITEKLFNDKRISLLAAFFLSSSLMFVQVAHTARVWLPQIMTILIAFYLIVILYQRREDKIKDYLFAGLSLGLAFGTHVVGIMAYSSFFIAHYLKNRGKKIKETFLTNKYFWLANLAIIICYLLTFYLNTYGFKNYINRQGKIWPNFSFLFDSSQLDQSAGAGLEAAKMNLFDKLIHYFGVLITYDPLLILLALGGFLVLFFRERGIFYLLFSFTAVYYFAISFIGLEQHYIVPIIPFIAMAAGYGVLALYKKINKTLFFSLMAPVMVIIFFLPIIGDYRMIQPGGRLAARDWIYKNIPSSSHIINFDPRLELNESKASLTDIKKFTEGFYTKKRAYLFAESETEYPRPNYYVLNYTYFNGLPKELFDKKYDYLLVPWNNPEDLKIALDRAKVFKSGLTLIKRFPESADENTETATMREDMPKPIWTILTVKTRGPILDIYKLK